MSDDRGPGLGQTLVGAGLLRVPMGIDQGVDCLGMGLGEDGFDEVAGALLEAAVDQ